jgi:hypothetical protein
MGHMVIAGVQISGTFCISREGLLIAPLGTLQIIIGQRTFLQHALSRDYRHIERINGGAEVNAERETSRGASLG